VVDPGAPYEELRDYLIRQLEELTDPDNGAKVIEKVYRREECYSGPYLANAPDLIVQEAGGYGMVKGGRQVLTKRPPNHPKSGDHRLAGVLMVNGPNIKKGSTVSEACVYDISPTILHLLGLPVPTDMDGQVLSEIFQPDSEVAQRVVVYCDEAEREKTRIKGKLAVLRNSRRV
jgi:predicted AlkP superfamily phosphohydrolase/phosphomutase